ncbi:albumin-like [Eleutherodactylus coqui]|uniref:albumin-like n=1 Tax=Eleutherodactylus coqui TaxID=57060 RepID=UPI00346376E4
MKWATLICLLFCTLPTEASHLKKRDAEDHSRHVGRIYLAVGGLNFNHLLEVVLAQNLQKSSPEELEKLTKEITTFAQHCADHEKDEECKKPIQTLFLDRVCKAPHLSERYPWSVDCCAKQDPERVQCFREHRNIEKEPHKRPDVDAACTEHKNNHERAVRKYVDEIATRHSSMPPTAVIGLAGQYDNIITICCAHESKKEKETCFDTKYAEVKKNTYYLESKQKQACHILKDFSERVLVGIELSEMGQQFCNADFEVVHQLTQEAAHMINDCCKGDKFECMVEKMVYTDHICENQEKLSPSLKVCCDKPILQRKRCMHALPKDHAPEDQSTDLKHLIEHEHVCKNFVEYQNIFLAKFLFGYAKTHQDSSVITCIRVTKRYMALLTKCCADVNSADCLKDVPQLLEAGIKQDQELTQQNCALYQKLGDHDYQSLLLRCYTPKMPQVTDATLLKITEEMMKITAKCCALPQNQIQACVEDKMAVLLGEMCERQSTTFINDQVRHCCVDAYVDRRPCFTKLGADPTYKAPEFDANAFQVGPDICEGTDEEKSNKRHILLIHAMKANPGMSDENKKELIGEFTKARVKCCAQEDHQHCFDEERPHILEILKKCLAH